MYKRQTHRFNAAMAKFDNDNAYFGLQFSSSEDSSSRNNTKSFTEYLKISLANGAMTEITEAEFEGAQDLSANITGEWTYGSDKSKVYRTNTQSGTTETLLSGENYYYITNDARWVVVLKAESAGAGTPTATIGYKTADVYKRQVCIRYLLMDHKFGPALDENGKKKRDTANKALEDIIRDNQKRFSSFKAETQDHYKRCIANCINTVLPMGLQFRDTYIKINLQEA